MKFLYTDEHRNDYRRKWEKSHKIEQDEKHKAYGIKKRLIESKIANSMKEGYPKEFKNYRLVKEYANYAMYEHTELHYTECFRLQDAVQKYWEDFYKLRLRKKKKY